MHPSGISRLPLLSIVKPLSYHIVNCLTVAFLRMSSDIPSAEDEDMLVPNIETCTQRKDGSTDRIGCHLDQSPRGLVT